MELNLFRSLTIRGLSSFLFLFLIDWKTKMESEWMMNFSKLLVKTIFSAKFIVEISAVNIEDSFGKHFLIFLLKTASYQVPLLSLEQRILISMIISSLSTSLYKINACIYPTSPPQAGCNTRSIFKWSLTDLNSVLFSDTFW